MDSDCPSPPRIQAGSFETLSAKPLTIRTARVLLGDSAGHQIEDGVITDAADLCPRCPTSASFCADIHRRDGVGTGDIVEHQGLAGDSGFAALAFAGYDNGAPEGADPAVPGDRSCIYIGRSLRCVMGQPYIRYRGSVPYRRM